MQMNNNLLIYIVNSLKWSSPYQKVESNREPSIYLHKVNSAVDPMGNP